MTRQSDFSKTPKIGLVSLGCPKALVDSERLVTQLQTEGYLIAPNYQRADLVVVNTCGFINTAIEESFDAIGEALAKNGRVIVIGCLGAKAEQVRSHFPAVLAVIGPNALEEAMTAIHNAIPPPSLPNTSSIPPAGLKLTPKHYAYLKISEGCQHRCTFCIIPTLRGNLVSRSVNDILTEAESLVKNGVKELILIAQDTSTYGVDLKHRVGFWKGRPIATRLTDLCQALGSLGVWIRLHYVYPHPSVDTLIPLMVSGSLLPYLDIPLQHASPKILKAMHRPVETMNTLARIQAWRTSCPDLVVRSTFIVGFPGETETDFEQILTFLSEAQLDRVGCFPYSDVEGAVANQLPYPVPEDIKQARQARLMQHQAEISAKRLERYRGKLLNVLIDQVTKEGAFGRGPGDSPEIDGQIIIKTSHRLTVGEQYQVRITDSDTHDLWAQLIR